MQSTTGIIFDIKLIPMFDGSSQPIAEWLEQLELVCELSGVLDVSRIIPLRLVGGGLAVYKELPHEDRQKTEKIREVLLGAFSVDSNVAHDEFTRRKLRFGEVPDVYLADVRSLANLAGGVSEKVLRSAFVSELSSRILQMMEVGARMESLTLCEVLERVLAILVEETNYRREDDLVAAADSDTSTLVLLRAFSSLKSTMTYNDFYDEWCVGSGERAPAYPDQRLQSPLKKDIGHLAYLCATGCTLFRNGSSKP